MTAQNSAKSLTQATYERLRAEVLCVCCAPQAG